MLRFYTVLVAGCSSVVMRLTADSCAAETKWNPKSNRTMWNGCNKCVIEKNCISNSCIGGVSETKQGLCKCPIVMSWSQSLGIHSGVMHTRYAYSLHLRILVLMYDCDFAYQMLQPTSQHNLHLLLYHEQVASEYFSHFSCQRHSSHWVLHEGILCFWRIEGLASTQAGKQLV